MQLIAVTNSIKKFLNIDGLRKRDSCGMCYALSQNIHATLASVYIIVNPPWIVFLVV